MKILYILRQKCIILPCWKVKYSGNTSVLQEKMTALSKIEGIGPKYQADLKKANIASVEGLLKAGSTPKGRKELAEASKISDKLILEWVNHADLFRIKGVGEEYSDLLEEAGVDTGC